MAKKLKGGFIINCDILNLLRMIAVIEEAKNAKITTMSSGEK